MWFQDYSDEDAAASFQFMGLPLSQADAKLWVIPVPWDATSSDLRGSAAAPQAILDYSSQMDLFWDQPHDTCQKGVAFLESYPKDISEQLAKQVCLLEHI